MEMQFIFMFLLCSGLISVSECTDSKRLLLNDPNIFQDRLNRIESMLTILQNTVKQQDSKNQQLELIIKQQAAAISKLKSFTSSSNSTSNRLNY
jgi:septal ring factor EnvC (AmiA/AmiB activator)